VPTAEHEVRFTYGGSLERPRENEEISERAWDGILALVDAGIMSWCCTNGAGHGLQTDPYWPTRNGEIMMAQTASHV
jgi:hypothetical protein